MEIKNPYPTYEEALERGSSKERSNQLHDLRIAFAQGSLSILEWLKEPCSEHPYFPYPMQGDSSEYREHRKDCPLCWAKFQSSGLSNLMGKFPDL
jgi:hypothetical protein